MFWLAGHVGIFSFGPVNGKALQVVLTTEYPQICLHTVASQCINLAGLPEQFFLSELSW